MLEETYLKIISAKTAELAAATKVGAILSGTDIKKDASNFMEESGSHFSNCR